MLLVSLLVLGCAFLGANGLERHTHVGLPGATTKGGFALPLHRKHQTPTQGRMLLRNSSYPLHGTVKDLGYFYATIYLGSPPREFAVIVDTGSTITYVPCASCGSNCGKHKDDAFDPATSSSFRSVSCSDSLCLCGNPSCQCHQDKCFYARHYAEQSSSEGFLIEDLFHLHDGSDAVPIRFGCETKETGEIFRQEADGIMGLGNSDASIINQLVAAKKIDDVFSMCFGSVEGDGVLLLGDVDIPSDIGLQFTPMLPTRAHYYIVRLDSIQLSGNMVNVRQGLYDIGYGVVLDSGTTFSYLPTEAYQNFLQLLDSHTKARGLQRVTGPDPRFANTDICWGGAPTIEQAHRLGDKFPTLQLNFGGGVQLSLHPLNYLFMHTRESGAYCLGVFDNGHQGTLLGGITFRNVLIKYDRRNQRVGFGYAACQRLGMDLAPPCDVMSVLQGDMAMYDTTECREVSTHRAQSSGTPPMGGQTTNATTPTPPQTPWTPNVNDPYNGGEQYGGDQAGAGAGEGGNDGGWRPGVEDGALKSEEGDMEGQGQVSVWQLILASAGVVLAVGGLLMGTLHVVALVRVRARGASPVRYAELQDMSPVHSDDEGDGDGDGRGGDGAHGRGVSQGDAVGVVVAMGTQSPPASSSSSPSRSLSPSSPSKWAGVDHATTTTPGVDHAAGTGRYQATTPVAAASPAFPAFPASPVSPVSPNSPNLLL